jgi:hypothetical protein
VGAVLYAERQCKAAERRLQYQALRLADDGRPVTSWK